MTKAAEVKETEAMGSGRLEAEFRTTVEAILADIQEDVRAFVNKEADTMGSDIVEDAETVRDAYPKILGIISNHGQRMHKEYLKMEPRVGIVYAECKCSLYTSAEEPGTSKNIMPADVTADTDVCQFCMHADWDEEHTFICNAR